MYYPLSPHNDVSELRWTIFVFLKNEYMYVKYMYIYVYTHAYVYTHFLNI